MPLATTDHVHRRLRVRASKARLAYASPWVTFGGAMAAVILVSVAMLWGGGDAPYSHSGPGLLWSLAAAASVLTRLGLSLHLKSAALDDAAVVRATQLYVWNAAFAGAVWGSAAWWLLPAQSVAQEGFLLVAMCMVLTGGVGGQASHHAAVNAFAVTLTLIFAAGLLRFSDRPHQLLGVGFVALCALLVLFARKQEAAIASAIELSLVNEELLGLRTEQERAARVAQADAEQARAQAEQAHRAKTAFIAAVGHDLRQPLHALVQYVGHLQRCLTQPHEQRTLAKIEDSVVAMEHLLNAVLDFSKISLGTIKPRLESVDLAQVLTSVDLQLRPLAQSKGLTLALQMRSAPLIVRSDAVLLERIVRNIAHNALRYTDRGAVQIRALQRGDLVRVLVGDSGIGLAQADKQRIFEEHYQIGDHTRDHSKGLGLGLAIVRELAELLGIRVRLKTQLGRGSTFALELRRADPPQLVAESVESAPATDHVRGALVVLIDDDAMARDGVATTLRDFGCRVIAAASGLQALRALTEAEFMPQVIVADLHLADGESGLQAIAALVAQHRALCGPGFDLPALVISGDTSAHELKRVAEAGFPLLYKPVGVKPLHRALNAALERLARPAAQVPHD